MVKYIKKLKQVIKDIVDERLNKVKRTDIFKVLEVNDDLTCNIERMNITGTYENVKISGLGIGNLKGIIAVPQPGDFVIATFPQDSNQPVIINSVFDTYSPSPDNYPKLNSNEIFISNKPNSAYLLFRDDDIVTIKSVDGAKFRLKPDGTFKLFDSNNYGIESDGDGNISIYGDLTIYGDISNLKYDDDDGDTVTTKSVYSDNSKESGDWS